MTRKDYKLIAECIRKSLEHMQDEWKHSPEMQDHMAVATAVIIRHLQNGLQQENSNFNAETFYKACTQ
jgi:hypothetical protein